MTIRSERKKEERNKALLPFITLLFFTFVMKEAGAEVLDFDKVWQQFLGRSPDMESVRKEREANEVAYKRSRLHWFPKVSLMTQLTDTNDPGQVFFNNLGQRSIQQTDFVPSDLNHPERQTFINGMVGIDLPLYEGGMKTNQVSMLQTMVRASEMDVKAKQTEQFGELSRQYGSLLIHSINLDSLRDLQSDLKRIISSYQVGAKSNPVGYSGLLGLKGVANRVEALITLLETEYRSHKQWINEKADLKGEWQPNSRMTLEAFLDKNLVEDTSQSISSMLLANELKASSLDDMADMERARYLPRIGLFANNNLYSGDRDTANSQSFGVYLMWELFNNDSYGRVAEARAKSLSAEAKIKSAKEEEFVMRTNLRTSRVALEKSLGLLKDSTELLSEQSRNSMKLFRSGLLNALQLAEVFNRRVDVIEDKNKAEVQYLEVRSRLHQISN